ncbi:MAG: DUF3990 domain-containing protein [Coriobacteriia bacterium]|nr:DUF3990 domain-containing protein [Coriobacteriia bacterium]
MLTLFHGSDQVLQQPRCDAGRPYNDFGPGLYCTESEELAREWAAGRGADGFVNRYSLDEAGLTVLDLGSGAFCPLHWLSVLLANRVFDLRSPLAMEAREYLLREFLVDVRGVDLVRGHRADDSYFVVAQEFLEGGISYGQLRDALALGREGEQVVVRTERAFERLRFAGAAPAPMAEWLARRTVRDVRLRKELLGAGQQPHQEGELFIGTIIDQEVRPGDERIR